VTPLHILVTVGSDHHPFNRLIRWMDAWVSAQEPGTVSCVSQYGTADPPLEGRGEPFLPHDELERLMTEADVVVTQGGPMGLLEARRCGTRPIAVPRLAHLGEVVDDHQVAFCRHLAKLGTIVIAEESATLSTALAAAVRDHQSYTVEPTAAVRHVQESVARFGELVASLPPRPALVPWRR
jgi:UDP-N-acetylglucosamine transferase subunit ALG13